MKHLLTLAALLVSTLSLAQQMPYNPDANGDDFVGVDDVLGVLGVYDTALMQPELTCDYEGTDLEQFIGGCFDQTLVIDSVYVEYLFADSVLTYLPGCPDPVYIETVLERSYVLDNVSSYAGSNEMTIDCYSSFLNYTRRFQMRFYSDGDYYLYLEDYEIAFVTNLNSYCEWLGGSGVTLPFPENWNLTSDGIEVDWSGWVNACDSFRVIPFWHEAE